MSLSVDQAIESRRSIRSFLTKPVEEKDLRAILKVAGRAPSGTNIQPWKVYVTQGAAKQRLTDALMQAYNDPEFVPASPYNYYPAKLPEPYLSRRRKIGWDMYQLLGIERGEKEKMHQQQGLNFDFFGAPVGLIFTLDARLAVGSILDYGMFLQNIMVAARGRGLDTCPQAAFTPFHPIIRDALSLPEGENVLCGMALGYADGNAIVNSLVSEREALEEFVTFMQE